MGGYEHTDFKKMLSAAWHKLDNKDSISSPPSSSSHIILQGIFTQPPPPPLPLDFHILTFLSSILIHFPSPVLLYYTHLIFGPFFPFSFSFLFLLSLVCFTHFLPFLPSVVLFACFLSSPPFSVAPLSFF